MENIELEESNVKTFKQLIKTPRKSVIARSEKQSDYIKALKENDIIISLGPAGTGKSFLAVSVGITMLMEKIERVILSRPAVDWRKIRILASWRYERKSRPIFKTAV